MKLNYKWFTSRINYWIARYNYWRACAKLVNQIEGRGDQLPEWFKESLKYKNAERIVGSDRIRDEK